MAPRRPRGRGRPGCDPRPAGHGLRRARRAAPGHRPLHHDRLPRRLRADGPSRILVLGPDSSVSPLIFAAIMPLVVTRRSVHGDRARRDDGRDGRADPDRPGCRQARLRRRPAVEGGPGRVHERAGHHDLRRAAPQAVRLLHRRRRFIEELRAFVKGSTANTGASSLGLAHARRAARAARPDEGPGRPGGGHRRHGRHGRLPVRSGVPTVGALRRVCRGRRCPGPSGHLGPMSVAAVGITLVSLTDTIATSTSFAARRGDEVDPNQEMIGIGRRTSPPGCSRASPCPPAVRAPQWPSSRVPRAS